METTTALKSTAFWDKALRCPLISQLGLSDQAHDVRRQEFMDQTHTVRTVFVVDDEKMVREGLREIFEKRYSGWTLAGSASTAQAALDFLQTHAVDLLITDIKMPGMDGLQLIEQLKKTNSELEIIILSGYDDFQFAKTAMQNKVFYYMLKPLDVDELDRILKEIEKNQIERAKDLVTRQNNQIEYTNSIINEILNDNLAAQSYLKSVYPDIFNHYALICIDMDMRQYANDGETVNDLHYLTDMRAFIKHYSSTYLSKSLVFFRSKSLWGIVLKAEEFDKIHTFAAQFLQRLEEEFHICAVAGVSDISMLDDDFARCFNHAYIAAKFRLTVEKGNCFFYESLEMSGELIPDRKLEEKLLNCIRTCDEENARGLFAQYWAEIVCARPTIFALTGCIKKFSYSVLCVLENAGLLDEDFLSQFNDVQDLQHFFKMDELEQAVLRLVIHACERFRESFEGRYCRVVESTIQFINEHYKQDIALSDLAEQAGINSNYLCSRFKAETDMTIVEYITFVRMEKAKALLRDHQYRLNDIAERIGYSDVKYFIRTFKKNIGVTPNDFRKYISE